MKHRHRWQRIISKVRGGKVTIIDWCNLCGTVRFNDRIYINDSTYMSVFTYREVNVS